MYKKEEIIKSKIIQEISDEITGLEKSLSQLKHSRERYISEDPSKEVIYAHGQTYDCDETNYLLVKKGMSFCNKYGEQGTITKLNEDRESVTAINFQTKEEEKFYIERFTSCGFYTLE